MSRRAAVAAAVFAAFTAAGTAPALAQQAVYIVRHAEKATDASEPGVPLSDEGKARAARLAGLLRDAGITAIYSTDTVRTRATAEPLARAGNRMVRVYSDAATLADLLRREPETTALVVGHSNTIPQLIAALGVREKVEIGDRDFDDLFIVVPRGTGEPLLLHLRY
jgi:broad specificity phosphatase PhoE